MVKRLDLPVVALDDADKVEKFAAAQKVVDDVVTWANPIGADGPDETGWQPPGRYHAAPCHAACEFGPVISEQVLADGRVHAVGTDQRIGFSSAAVLESQPHAAVVLIETGKAVVEVNGVIFLAAHCIGEHFLQIARWNIR